MSEIFPGVDHTQAAFWNGMIQRKEIMPVIEEHAQAIIALNETVAMSRLTIAFLLDKLKATPEEVQEFLQRVSAPVPEPPSTLIVSE